MAVELQKLSDLVAEVNRELDSPEGPKAEFAREIAACYEVGLAGDSSFPCRRCGQDFAPVKGQWIFYKLCDGCFAEWNWHRTSSSLAFKYSASW